MSASSDDFYALLGIPADADDEALRRAWRRLALEWHPDRAGPEATADFQRISVAYSVLSDPAVARHAEPDVIELFLEPEEIAVLPRLNRWLLV